MVARAAGLGLIVTGLLMVSLGVVAGVVYGGGGGALVVDWVGLLLTLVGALFERAAPAYEEDKRAGWLAPLPPPRAGRSLPPPGR